MRSLLLRSGRCRLLLLAVVALTGLPLVSPARPTAPLPEVRVDGTGFRTVAGAPVWLNGINTAWIAWNDFGSERFDAARWHEEFARYAAAGVNCARLWVDCDGAAAVTFGADGRVTGPSPSFYRDLDALLALAAEHRIYVLAVLTSFDHVKPTAPRSKQWRRVFNDDACLASYTENFVVPLAQRYAADPHLLAWEICNEPEWIWFWPWRISRDRVIAFHARVAAALHGVSAKPVTTGSASWRWHADNLPTSSRHHAWSDQALRARHDDPGARLDFFQVHYYDWMVRLGYNPYATGATPAYFLKNVDRPVIIGETLGRYSHAARLSVEQMYTIGAAHGYAGVFGWSARGHDGEGTFEEIAAATRTMANRLLVAARDMPELLLGDEDDDATDTEESALAAHDATATATAEIARSEAPADLDPSG